MSLSMVSIYFHWSYCLSKCIYCDFGSQILNKNVNQEEYCKCCIKQLHYFYNKINNSKTFNEIQNFNNKKHNNKNDKHIETIYFGGGTPSLLEPRIIEKILNEVDKIYGIADNCEISLEANPTSFEVDKFTDFKMAGINRLSLGIQSFDDNELLFLGRKHTSKEAIKVIEFVKKHFDKWSFDLIYGLPKQTLERWISELKTAIELEPQHLSLYTLIVDKNTPLGRLVEIGNIKPKTNDEMSIFYNKTNEYIMNNSKLIQYEVSNYAISGFESKHNMNYWKSNDYIGICAGAHGRLWYNDGNRYEIQNIFSPNSWQNNVLNGKNGLEIEKVLTKQEQAEEILLMGLRIKDGIDFEDIRNRFDIDLFDFLNKKQLEVEIKNGYLLFNNKVLKTTAKGLIILDTILKNIVL